MTNVYPKPETPYRIYFVNHDYFSSTEFATVEEAKDYGRSKGMEFVVYEGDRRVCSWSVFGGWR